MIGIRRAAAVGLAVLLTVSSAGVEPLAAAGVVLRAVPGRVVTAPGAAVLPSGSVAGLSILPGQYLNSSRMPTLGAVLPRAAIEPVSRPVKAMTQVRTYVAQTAKRQKVLSKSIGRASGGEIHARAGRMFEGLRNHAKFEPGPETSVAGSFSRMRNQLERGVEQEDETEENIPSPTLKAPKKKKRQSPAARRKGAWKKFLIASVLGVTALVGAYLYYAPRLDPVSPPATVVVIDKAPFELEEQGGAKIVRLESAEAKGKLYELAGHKDVVRSVSVREDGKAVVTVDEDGVWKVWDLENGKTYGPKDYPGKVRSALFTDSGRKLILVDEDATVRIADLQGGGVQTITQDIGALKFMAISPDAQRVTFVTKSKDVHILKIEDAKSRSFKVEGKVLALATTDRGVMLLTSKRGIAKLWRIEAGKAPAVVLEKYLPGLRMIASAVSRNGNVMFAVADMAGDQVVLAWNFSKEKIDIVSAEDFGREEIEFASVATNKDGSRSVIITRDGELWLWNPGSAPELLAGASSGAHVFLTRDGGQVYMTDAEGGVHVWSLHPE